MTTEDGVQATGGEQGGGGEPARGPTAAPPRGRRPWVALGLIAVGVVGAGAAGLFLYAFSAVGKSKSVAHEHLPPTCDVVARADVARIQALPAFQAKVKPAIDELTRESTALDDPDAADLRSFFLEARLDPSRDVDEVAVCVRDPVGGGAFAVVVGGTFSPGGVVDAAANRGESSERVTIGGRPAVKAKSKKNGQVVLLGQAEDGAIILSNDEALLAAALPKSDAHEKVYALSTTAEMSAVVTAGLLSKQADRIRANPMARGLAPVTAASASVAFATPALQARLVTASPADATNVEREIAGLVSLARLKSTFLGGGGAKPGLVDTLLAVKPSVQGSDVVLDVPWSAQGVDELMDAAAEGLRKAKKKP